MSYDRERYQRIVREQLQFNAEQLKPRAEAITRYVHSLQTTPNFLTLAEAALEDAELALTETLLAVKLARSAYQRLPKADQLIAAE